MDEIVIKDLEVCYHVGVTDEERRAPQRLSLTVVMEYDIGAAALHDSIEQTVDYYAVSRRLMGFGNGRCWKLIETLAAELAQMILKEFRPQQVRVEVKKFILAEARYVSVRVTRGRSD